MPAFCAAKPSRRHSASDKISATQQHVDRWAARCATVEGELLDLRAEKEKSDEGNGRLMAIMTADKKKLQQELAGSEAALEAALHDRAYLEGLVNQQLDEVEKKYKEDIQLAKVDTMQKEFNMFVDGRRQCHAREIEDPKVCEATLLKCIHEAEKCNQVDQVALDQYSVHCSVPNM